MTPSTPTPSPRQPRPEAIRVAVLGVTGAPASGKSTVCAKLAQLGCPVIDVDALGHEALDVPAVRSRVVALFGEGVLANDGRIDRPALGQRVFGDAPALDKLERIVHPAVRSLLEERLASVMEDVRATAQTEAQVIVLECALLFEGGLERLCDAVLCVDAQRELRAARALEHRNWSDEDLARRERRQLSADEKRRRSHVVLDNDQNPEELDAALQALLDHLTLLTPSRPSPAPHGGTQGTRS